MSNDSWQLDYTGLFLFYLLDERTYGVAKLSALLCMQYASVQLLYYNRPLLEINILI